MKEITGVAREMQRDRVKAPLDKVHRNSNADGLIKGCRAVMLNGKLLMPRGMTGFWYQYKKDIGIKVYYSFHHNRCCRLRTVKRQFKKHKKLYELGIATKPMKVVEVKLDFDYFGKRKEFVRHVHCHAYGIKSQAVEVHEKAWLAYASGKPYNWKAVDHPFHCPKGYLAFCDKAKKVLKKAKIGVCGDWPFKEQENPKLGDILPHIKEKRYYLVDIG